MRVVHVELPSPTAARRALRDALADDTARDGAGPVDVDAELLGRDGEALLAGGERDRGALELPRAGLEQLARFVDVQPADVDAGDRDSWRKLGAGACEGQPDESRDDDQEQSN